MEITLDLISYLEKLGRIKLTDDEKEKTLIDLRSILGYIDKLNELDTDSVEPLSHAFPITNVYREDIVSNTDQRDAILSNAPAQKDGCFKVPKTVE
jgi:aspartyl-tRNA(Asn)/glutamyl-tRNA(Gln) amidotransferase subunit C